MERFVQNSVAEHLAPHSTVDDLETTVISNRFDFVKEVVVDREVYGLYEPFSFCKFTKAQMDEFGMMQGDSLMENKTKAVTTLNRAASRLARWHDILFFIGHTKEGLRLKPDFIEMPNPQLKPPSLYEAALEVEKEKNEKAIPVEDAINEDLVAAVYDAVVRLEGRGYYTKYNLVLGQNLWRALHTPTSGSLVLPRDRIEPTLMGGGFYRTTTLPDNEALLASMDGPTFDCVRAGDPAQQPRFEFLRVEPGKDQEELYLFRVRERFAPRVRENRAIVRLQYYNP
jgi:Encapsulating protein for peroxidase